MYSVVIGLAVLLAAPAPKELKKPDPTIVGEWTIESVVLMGKPLPVPGPSTLTFKADGTCEASEGNGGKPEITHFTYDPKQKPAHIDLAESDRMKSLGIYKVEEDALTICLATDGERPTKFESGDKILVFKLKRKKKD